MRTFSKNAGGPLAALSYRQITLAGALLSATLALLIFLAVWRQEHAYTTARFYLDARATAGAVQQVLDYSTHDFAAARSLFLASDEITRSEFNTFITDQLKTNPLPGLLAIEWIPYVKAEQRAQFEQAAQADGLNNFYFTQRDKEGRFVRASLRAAYYPAYFVAPQEAWNHILGFDAGSDSTRFAALQEARDTGRAAAITAVILTPPTYDLKGSLVFLPIYEPGLPLATVEDRRNHLRGFLLGVFDWQALLAASQNAQASITQGLYLLDPDLPPNQQLVISGPAGAPPADDPGLVASPSTSLDQLRSGVHQVHEIQVADETWQLLITAAEPIDGLFYPLPLVTGLATFAFSILATAYLARRRQAEEILQKSEEQYRLVVENVADIIWAIDADNMHIQFVTPSVSELTGLPVDDVLLLTLPQLLGAESAAHMQALMPERTGAARNGLNGPYVDELALQRRDGSLVWTETTSHLAVNPQTEQLQMYGISRDITERRRIARIQAAQFAVSRILAQSPRLYDAIVQVLESLSLGLNWLAAEFWQPSADGKRLEWCSGWWAADNQDVEHFMNLSQEHTFMRGQGLIGRTWQENRVFWEENIGDYPDYPRHAIGQSAGLRSAVSVPICIDNDLLGVMVFHDNSARPIDHQLLETLADLGRQIGQFIARKQTEIDLHNEQALLAQRVQERTVDLRQANAELAHALRAKDEFLANMSHELRTPLNSILTLNESLQEGTYGALNERQLKSLNLIEQSGYHLLALINDVLDLAKVEAGKLDLQIERISALAVPQASLALVHEMASKKSIHLALKSDAAKDSTLAADPRRLKQILVNLLGNAIKFTSAGGHVTLSIAQRPDAIEFAVQDDGIGIPPAQQGKLFQPFTQLDAGLARQYEGTGLGLALVRRLVDLHRGQIWVESSGVSGQGSCFVVSIPWEDSAPDRDGGPGEDGPSQVDSAPDAETAPALDESRNRAKLLVVDDNDLNLLALEDYLMNAGYQLVFARDGKEALHLVAEICPDLIVMDIQMPQMNGLEATRLLRSNPRFATIPVLALTALAMPGDREMCLAAGANACITKPYRLKDMVKLIEELLPHSSEQAVS